MNQRTLAGQVRPVRQLTTTSPHRTVGGIFIPGLTPYVAEYESYNEKHAILTLALCHDVLRIKSQPTKTHYIKSSGKAGYHIPDFEIDTKDGPLLLEIKAIENLLETRNIAKYLELALHYRREQATYRFLTNVQIEAKPRFQTILLLQRYLANKPDGAKFDAAYSALSGGAVRICELMGRTQLALADIYALVANRKLCIDWSHPLTPQAYISLPNQPFRGLLLEDIFSSTRFCSVLEGLAMGSEPTDQSVLAAAKTWRRSDNMPQLWGMVGGFAAESPVNSINEIRFLRAAHHRRNYAPGHIDQKGGE